MNIQLEPIKNNSKQVKKAKQKVKYAQYQPTWKEVWETGYTPPSGKFKRGVFIYPLSPTELERLQEVKSAIETGELGVGVESLKKFSKAHALRLYTVLLEIRKEEYIKSVIENKPDNYILITDQLAFIKLRQLMRTEKEIALDTETTGLGEKDRIVGISVSLPYINKHFYIPVRHVGVQQLDANYVFDALKGLLESERLGKILHNAKFDSHMFYKEGIDLKGITMDTMLAMHVLNENEPSYALKKLATKYGKHFGFEDKSWDYETLFGRGGFQDTPLDIGTYYACKDTHLTISLANFIREQFKQHPNLGKAYALENATLEVAIAMEREGVLIDLNYGKQYANELKEQLNQLELYLLKELKVKNINSNPQLLEAFKAKGILDSKAKSIGKNVLKPLKHKHKVIANLLEYRKLSKLYNTYIHPLPEKIRATGRLHGMFNQHTTVTGRFSSNEPNLQNIPPKARGMFIPEKGFMFVGIDYSQIEPRYLAHETGDKHFQAPYLEGRDLYSELASKTFKVPIEDCGDDTKYRKDMKMGLLATMYGITPFQLGESLDISTEDAEQFLEDFLTAYPTTSQWIESIHQLVQFQGYVDILGGRKRRFPEIKKVAKQYHSINNRLCKKLRVKSIKNIWTTSLPYEDKSMYWNIAKQYFRVLRQAVNAIIQGSSATIMKMAMVEVYKYIKPKGNEWKLILTVHDELIFEIPRTATTSEIQELADCMTRIITLDVPMKVDVEIMLNNWADKISFKEWQKNHEGVI